MKNIIASALLLLAPALVAAQTAPANPAAAAAAAKSAAAAAKSAGEAAKSAKAAAKSATAAAAKPAGGAAKSAEKKPSASRTEAKSTANQMATGIMAAEAALSPEEVKLAERVHVGRLPCELGAYVNVEADAKSPGYFNVDIKGAKYRMFPVASRTGAIRLEDQRAGTVWLQLANKSMLMDQKAGKRLADECMSPDQSAVAEALKKNPAPSLLDALPAALPASAPAATPASAPAAAASMPAAPMSAAPAQPASAAR